MREEGQEELWAGSSGLVLMNVVCQGPGVYALSLSQALRHSAPRPSPASAFASPASSLHSTTQPASARRPLKVVLCFFCGIWDKHRCRGAQRKRPKLGANAQQRVFGRISDVLSDKMARS